MDDRTLRTVVYIVGSCDSDVSFSGWKSTHTLNLFLSQLLDETNRMVIVLIKLVRQKQQALVEVSKLSCDLGLYDSLVWFPSSSGWNVSMRLVIAASFMAPLAMCCSLDPGRCFCQSC
jgi:hypothetical protein